MIMMIKKKNVQDICSMQTRCYAFYIHDVTQSSKPVVPNLFGTRDWFCGRQIFHRPGQKSGLGMIQAHCIYCALYFHFVAISGYSTVTLGLGFGFLWESNAAADLTGGRAQAIT